MIKTLIPFFFLFFLFENTIASDSIVFAIDPTKAPMQFVSKDGEAIGYEIDFVNEMARLGGFTPVFKKVQWQSLFEGLVNDEYDAVCASVSITEERKQSMDFTIPYYNVSQAILVLKNSAINKLADLKGKKVGAKKGTTSSKALSQYQDIEIVSFTDVPSAIQSLSSKIIDAVICDGPVAGHYALVDDTYDLKLVTVIKTENPELYGIAVKKGNKPLLNRLNRAITAVQSKNKDIEFQEKWFSELLSKSAQ